MVRLLLTAGDAPADAVLRRQLLSYQIEADFCPAGGDLLLCQLVREPYDAVVLRCAPAELTPVTLRYAYLARLRRATRPLLARPATLFFAVLRGPDAAYRRLLTENGYAAVLTLPLSEYRLARTVLEKVDRVQQDYSDAQDALRDQYARQLRELGIPSHLKGFSYLVECLVYLASDPDALYQVTKVLYPQVARCKCTSAANLERSMRTALDKAWSARGPLTELAGDAGRPCTREVLAMLSRQTPLPNRQIKAL